MSTKLKLGWIELAFKMQPRFGVHYRFVGKSPLNPIVVFDAIGKEVRICN